MIKSWYYIKDGNKHGPTLETELKLMASSGHCCRTIWFGVLEWQVGFQPIQSSRSLIKTLVQF